MAYTVFVESAIRTELTSRGPCTLEALLQRLSQFSWNEVFAAIDRLSREGRLVLRHPTRFNYEVSIGTTQPASELVHAGRDAEGDMQSGHEDPDSRAYEERTYS
jgi:hypothetical protein